MRKKKARGPETEVLFAEPLEIAGYTVKPWTMKQFAVVYPAVKAIVDRLVAGGMSLDNLEIFLEDRLVDLLPEFLPLLPALLAGSLEISPEEAEGLDWTMALLLTMAIFRQNVVPLKNFLSLIPHSLAGIRDFTPSP